MGPRTVTITTSAGEITAGQTHGVISARGIRFATAERFAAAMPTEHSADPILGLESGPICPQIPSALDRLLAISQRPMSEDCLFLDVHTPGVDDGRRAVIVWIHGGAFVTGAGSLPWYDGANLARQGDVVVVSFNYRLGAFGFIGAEDLGLRDQLTALHWVQRHIASFGGDPERVTVLGESAGGASVVALMAAPSSTGLFARAWAMSPSLPQIRTAQRADEAFHELLTAAGVETAGPFEALRRLETDALLKAQARVLERRAGALSAFAPTAPGTVIEDLTAAHRDPRPLVVGTTRDEMQLFTAFDPAYSSMDNAGVHRRLGHRFADPDAVIALYRRHRTGAGLAQLVSAVQTDEMFRMPVLRLLEGRDAAGTASWAYWFTKPTPAFGGLLGACHGLDIPYIFDNLEQPGVEMFTGSDPRRGQLAAQMSADLIRFAATGAAPWAAYEAEDRVTRVYGESMADLSDPEPELRSLWERADTRPD